MHIRRFSLFITLFSLFAMFTPAAVFADAAADLKNVQKAREDGQPKTALTLVEPLIAAALTAQDYDIALAAILEKATISAVIERRGGEAAAIRILTPYFESAPLALKPMLAAALAHAWQRYYDHHHWDLLHRSRAQDDSADFLTWDATRVRAEIRRYYTLALADTAALQRTPVTAFGTFLACDANREPAFRPDALRPTLYDFLVHDAIDFHSLGEQGITQAEDHFQPAADSPLLGSLEEFLDWKPQTNDTDSAALHAIRLFQDVLRFHLNDTSPLALSDADLQRILWAGKTLSRSTDTDARVEHALRAHIKRWQSEETASDAAAELSSLLREKNPLEAYKVAVQGLALHPSSAAAARCRSLIAQIEDPQLDSIKTESVWNASTPEIAIQYRNIETIHFRAVAADWQEFLASKRNRPDSLNAAEFAALLKKNPVKTWQVALPKTADYVMRTHRVDAPDDLAPGFYFIIASVSEKFSPKKNAIIYTTAWVSDLALLFGGEPALGASGRLEGLVLNAITGEPVPDATVTGWYLRHSKSGGERVKLQVAKTDATGAFSIHSPNREDTLLLAEGPGGHSISSDAASSYANYRSPSAAPERTRYYIRFFTDRAIYRPGQSIQFKAVVFTANRDTNQYAIAAGRKIAVVLDDPNRKEAARLELRTNGYGTASGSFIVPPGRINGSYTFHTVGAENGRSTIQIEEYKRPKFEVLLAAPATPPKLDAPVTLTGTATAYTGAPVDGAKVEWKVMRTAQWPRWCWWRVPTAGRAIAHGTAATDASGKFTIQFTAEPDKATDPKDEPRFNYQITADVTDATGETRVGIRRVAIGYAAINAEIAVGAWQTSDAPVALKVSTASLDGEPREATGQLVIYALRQPAKVIRSKLLSYRDWDSDGEAESEKHPGDSRTWAEGDSIFTHSFTTDATGIGTLHAKLPVGIYRAVLTTADNFGQPVRARTEITVADPAATRGAVRVPFAFNVEKNEFQPGDTFAALWSSGYDTARALVSIKHRGKTLQRFWTDPARTQQKIAFPVTEELRGGFTVQIAQVRENRFYKQERKIDVPWSNKELNLGWERFNSKLVPGGRETWTLRIKNPNAAGPSPVELAATLYDVSLDQFAPHTWGNLRGIFYNENYSSSINFANAWKAGIGKVNDLVDTKGRVSTFMGSYRSWPSGDPNPVALSSVASHDGIAPSANRAASAVGGTSPELEVKAPVSAVIPPSGLDAITVRKNLQETAFFFPAIIADPDGTARLEFTAPEVLTGWKFLAFAHDAQLRSGVFADASIVTSSALMVQPNAPRFVREGDTLELTIKLTNKTDKLQTGRVRLNFSDALSLDSADTRLDNETPEREFTLSPHSSQAIAWRIQIPDGQGYLIYKAVAASGLVSDGEEGFLPVLSRRQLVSESITLPIHNPVAAEIVALSKTFRFEKLLASGTDTTLRHESLSAQVVSNPAWYAVMALPYLMEFPHECSEQLFSRYYANALSKHIANADPKIASVFEQWRNTPVLESALFKNKDMKSVLIAETPWVREAESESTQRRNVGILFDKKRVDAELDAALKKLADRQLPDGSWAWFPGGSASDYITRHIVAGFGRLGHLGCAVDNAPAVKALDSLDAWLAAEFVRIKDDAGKRGKNYKDENHLTSMHAFHLYARSFFQGNPVAASATEAYDYFFEQASIHWLKLGRQSQAHIALALHRRSLPSASGGPETPDSGQAGSIAAKILSSLREHTKSDPELGTYWAAEDNGWFWHQAPIETHALLIEAFSEIAPDPAFVDELQTWLLKQKQTQAWPTTKATADAVYALLLRGVDKLASDTPVSIKLGDRLVVPSYLEAGTGFYSERLTGAIVRPEMGDITVTKHNTGTSWGSVTWQYFQEIGKITAHDATPLKLKKTLWKKVLTKNGEELVPVQQSKVSPGDTLVVRLELRADRDFEFVHLKDQRGSGTEPVNVVSGYRWRNGLGFYESTGDTATHFFIDSLPSGTHVFEYPVRVQLRGVYQSGIAQIQSMYAPEFNAHSESTPLVVE